MRINQAGLDLIKQFEGCKLKAYKDIKGIWTIGYGHTGHDVTPGLSISQDKADSLLQDDLDAFEHGVEKLVVSELNPNQFSALVCFSYNVGLGNLKASHLLGYVNMESFNLASDEFLRWDRAGGVVVPGLLRRREAERALFLLEP